MKITIKKFVNTYCKFIQSFDMFGRKISFTYKGEDEYKTYIGGFTSAVIFCTILLYVYVLLDVMIKRDDTTKNTNLLIRNLYNDFSNSSLASSNMSFAFHLRNDSSDNANNFLKDSTYFDVEFKQVFTENGAQNEYPVNLVNCTESNFRFGNEDQFAEFDVTDEDVCPEHYNLFVLGNQQNSRYSFFELNIKKCQNSTGSSTCKSLAAINEAADDLEFEFTLVNSYFDFDEYTNSPIKNFVDSRFQFNLISDREKTVKVFIKENEAELKDSFYRFNDDGESKSYLSINRNEQDVRNIRSTNNLITIRFAKDYDYESYEREVFSLLDLFGNLGGVFEILTIFGGLFVGVFADRFFNYSIISSLYHIDPLSHDAYKDIYDHEDDGNHPDLSRPKDSLQRLESHEMSEEQKTPQKKDKQYEIATKDKQNSLNVSGDLDEASDK